MPKERKPKKRKPRTPYGYRVETEPGRILERSLKLPQEWPYRDELLQFGAAHGMAEKWVAAIDRVFPAQWLREQVDGAHEVARWMCSSWPLATRNIADIADAIVATQHAAAGHDEVTKRLQVHEQYLGALFEAQVARLAHEAGLPFAFASSKGAEGPAADIRVAAEQSFVLEVKHVENAFRARVPEILTDFVSHALGLAFPLGTRVEFNWSGEDVASIEETDDADKQIESLALRAITQLRASLALERFEEALDVSVERVGIVRITPGASSMPESISYETTLQDHVNERRLARRIRRASRQLDPGIAGVMVLCGEPDVLSGECTARLAADLLRSEGASLPQLAGVIVLVTTRNENVIEATWPVPNPFARTELSQLPLPHVAAPMTRRRFTTLRDLVRRSPVQER